MPHVVFNVPPEHYRLLKEICDNTETSGDQVVAQAIMTLYMIHMGMWRIEDNGAAPTDTPKVDLVQMTLDDLYWFLGIGRFGQSDFEINQLPTIFENIITGIKRTKAIINSTPDPPQRPDPSLPSNPE